MLGGGGGGKGEMYFRFETPFFLLGLVLRVEGREVMVRGKGKGVECLWFEPPGQCLFRVLWLLGFW